MEDQAECSQLFTDGSRRYSVPADGDHELSEWRPYEPFASGHFSGRLNRERWKTIQAGAMSSRQWRDGNRALARHPQPTQ